MKINKFIIKNNDLILGHVEYHRQLVDEKEIYKIIGGGRWEYNPEDYGDVIFFFGKSADFGPVSKFQFETAWEAAKTKPEFAKFVNSKVIFSNHDYFLDVLLEHNSI